MRIVSDAQSIVHYAVFWPIRGTAAALYSGLCTHTVCILYLQILLHLYARVHSIASQERPEFINRAMVDHLQLFGICRVQLEEAHLCDAVSTFFLIPPCEVPGTPIHETSRHESILTRLFSRRQGIYSGVPLPLQPNKSTKNQPIWHGSLISFGTTLRKKFTVPEMKTTSGNMWGKTQN